MKQPNRLIAVDLATGGAVDYNALGAGLQQVRLHFANASFPSVEEHKDALHREVSDHVQMAHHHQGLLPLNMEETLHEGEPAYVVTVHNHSL